MSNAYTQDKNGKWIEAIPISLMCEFKGCKETNITGKIEDYFRNSEECDGTDWNDEPICLCEKHSKNHIKCPKNLDDAINWVLEITKDDSNGLNEWLQFNENEAIATSHHNLGMHIRNSLGLWHDGSMVPYFNSLGIYHADDMSAIILTSLYRKKNNIDIKLDEQIKFYIDYWEKENSDVNKGIL